MEYSHRWSGGEGRGGVTERRWILEITPVRPNTGHTHTFNAIKQQYYRKNIKVRMFE